MENASNKWYSSLISECNTLCEKWGLDDPGTEEFRNFVVNIAKEQYKTGNRSGIKWVYRKMNAQPQMQAA